MPDIVVAERATAAVFEPFLGGLVAADVEFPDGLGHAVEVLGIVDVDVTVIKLGIALGNHIISLAEIAVAHLLQGVVLQQMQGDQLRTDGGDGAEAPGGLGIGNAREVDLQKLLVALAVAGVMEDAVNIMEQVFRGDGLRCIG